VWKLAGLPEPKPIITALTISLNSTEIMARDAADAAAKGYKLLKVKLNGEGDVERVAAVRKAAPDARLVIDANEAWEDIDLAQRLKDLADLGVELVEQPVAAGFEDELEEIDSPVPLCADESCHTSEDLDRVKSSFQAVNIKLDKAGGLTEALRLRKVAEEAGLDVMVGCMLSTSLGIGPAYLLAQGTKWADLDGPALLAKDRPGGFMFKDGMISPR